nr:retrovirus-related Pol polyprotein from transposon TNT 1-94 [Tanacetum cinerariifolium]
LDLSKDTKPYIKDWLSNDEEEKVEKKEVKPSIKRINFVKATTDNNPRETVKNEKVKKLERKRRFRTPGMNLFKIGTSKRSLAEDDASKQGKNLKQRTPEELPKAAEYLKKEFEMKDLRKAKFYLGLQIEHLKNGILIHQNAYIEKLLKRFYMDTSHPLRTPMVVRTLDFEKDHFRPPNGGEEAQTIIHEDNAACIAQLKDGYIKGDKNKHILLEFFTHDLQKSCDIIVQQVRSSVNLADLFTKALPTVTFKKLVNDIGMQRLEELK